MPDEDTCQFVLCPDAQIVAVVRHPTYSLCVYLCDICHSLRQHITWHLVAVLVSELCCFCSCTTDLVASVWYWAGHDAAD